jgi:hypothetical protein
MKYYNESINLIIKLEATRDTTGTNYEKRFTKTTETETVHKNLPEKAMFWLFFEIKALIAEGELDILENVKAKDTDLKIWYQGMQALDILRNGKLNIFDVSQLQYLTHLICEVVNYVGKSDSEYLHYMFNDTKKNVNTYWSFDPSYPLILQKMIDIVKVTSTEKALIEKDYADMKDNSQIIKCNITPESIKVFSDKWKQDTKSLYGDVYLLSHSSEDELLQGFGDANKGFVRRNAEGLQKAIKEIIDQQYIDIMNKIYDHKFDYKVLTKEDIEHIHKIRQNLFKCINEEHRAIADSMAQSHFDQIKDAIEIFKTKEIVIGLGAGAGASLIALEIGVLVFTAVFVSLDLLFFPISLAATSVCGALIGVFFCYFYKLTESQDARAFVHSFNNLTKMEVARVESIENEDDYQTLLLREVALFSAFNTDEEAHDVPTLIEEGYFLDDILYHGEHIERGNLYTLIKSVMV